MRTLDLNSLFIRQFLEETLAHGDLHGQRLLDLGCGTIPYKDIYSLSHSLSVAADFDIRSTIDVRLRADVLPFCDSSFDTVLITEVIEHLPYPAHAIAEIVRVLKPAGRLVMTWPFAFSLHELPHDYNRFTEFGMAITLEQHGLRVESLRRRGDMLSVLVTLVGQLLTGFGLLVTRTPVLGPLLRFISWACTAFNNALVLITYWSTKSSARLYPDRPGARLSGTGQLAQWTLGYCLVARKYETEN
jgi:SAM-dependent methyltransferase